MVSVSILLCVAACSDQDGSAASTPSCEEQTAQAAQHVAAAADAEENRSCQTDDDCKIVWLISDCHDSCSRVVSRDGAERVRAAIAEANAEYCAGFEQRRCFLVIPPCDPPPPGVACANGDCTGAYP
jgi:hypothetical protein